MLMTVVAEVGRRLILVQAISGGRCPGILERQHYQQENKEDSFHDANTIIDAPNGPYTLNSDQSINQAYFIADSKNNTGASARPSRLQALATPVPKVPALFLRARAMTDRAAVSPSFPTTTATRMSDHPVSVPDTFKTAILSITTLRV